MLLNIDVVPESTYHPQGNEKQRILWLGLLVGPVIYALYFITGYLVVEFACNTGVLQRTVGGLSFYAVLVLALTLLAALITLLTGLSNMHRWRRHAVSNGEPESAEPFMLFGGVLLSVFFTSLILLTGIPVLVLQSCRWL